jgi:acetyl-CoA acetyltransferase
VGTFSGDGEAAAQGQRAAVSDPGLRDVYIVGAAESPLGRVVDHSELSMAALASREALEEAGLTLADVDGLFVNYMGEEGSVQVGEYLGIQPRYADSSDLGGGAFEAFVHHAMLAISARRCQVALVTYASRQRTKRGRAMTRTYDDSTITGQFETPYGLPPPIGHYALAASRHMYQYGTTPEQLALVAVTAREWARLNPKAWNRQPLTVEDVLASPTMCDPLHKLDCCLRTDGGGAVVITNGARAKDTRKKPVRVIGAGESHTHWHIDQMNDLTTTAGVVSGREAFGMAGIKPSDVDVFEPYDAFTISVILQLEDLGFCKKGEGGAFVQEGRLRLHGDLPSMTSGGGLSYNHPGAFGLQLLIESVRQLRGEAGARQVDGAEVAVAHGIGGFLSTAATVVLARD